MLDRLTKGPSPKQKAKLAYLKIDWPTTREEAGEALDEIQGDPYYRDELKAWDLEKFDLHPDLYEEDGRSYEQMEKSWELKRKREEEALGCFQQLTAIIFGGGGTILGAKFCGQWFGFWGYPLGFFGGMICGALLGGFVLASFHSAKPSSKAIQVVRGGRGGILFGGVIAIAAALVLKTIGFNSFWVAVLIIALALMLKNLLTRSR